MKDFNEYLSRVFDNDESKICIYKFTFGDGIPDMVTLALRESLVDTIVDITGSGSQDFERFCADTLIKFLINYP